MSDCATTTVREAQPFRILDLAGRSDAGHFDVPASLPRLRDLVCELFDLQSDPQENNGRWYQKSLLQRRFFEISSPRTGDRIRSGASLIVNGSISYRFPSDPNLLLVSPFERISQGYPIAGIVCLASRLICRLGDPTWGVRAVSVDAVEAMLRDPQWRTAGEALEVRIITGDWNFAQHVWNQLGALEKFAQSVDPGAPVTIETTHQPLGPVAELLPELTALRVVPRDWRAASENKPGRVDVFLGGIVLSKTILERVRQVAIARASQQWRMTAERLAKQHTPVVWISIRTVNRTAVNQLETLTCLCKRLFADYPRCAIILDGYSLPDDFPTNASYGNKAKQNVASDVAAASAIAEAVGLPGQGQDLVIAVGLNVLEFGSAGPRCRFLRLSSRDGPAQDRLARGQAWSGAHQPARAASGSGELDFSTDRRPAGDAIYSGGIRQGIRRRVGKDRTRALRTFRQL